MALWAVVLFQGVVIFLLLRQLGLMYLGTAQGIARDGLAVGKRAPQFTAVGLSGDQITLQERLSLPLLLIFGSPTCGPCKSLVPHLNEFAAERTGELHVLFLSRGSVDDARRFATEQAVHVPLAAHPDDALPDRFQARVTPFGFVIGSDGTVLAKGLVNNREHLDMLVHMAGEELRHAGGEHSRNGSSVIEPSEVRS
jgi:methylamine dehydrogenase accessory protein MauD